MPGGLVMLMLMPIAGWLTGMVQPKYLVAFGMLLTACGLYYMTSLSPDADFGFFAWARVFQTLGPPFLFIPITSALLCRLAAGKNQRSCGSDQCRAQCRRQHRRIAGDHDACPA